MLPQTPEFFLSAARVWNQSLLLQNLGTSLAKTNAESGAFAFHKLPTDSRHAPSKGAGGDQARRSFVAQDFDGKHARR